MMTLGGTGVDAPIPVAVGRSHSVLPVSTDLPSSANGRCLREADDGCRAVKRSLRVATV